MVRLNTCCCRTAVQVVDGRPSCHFTVSEVQERWYALLYDPVISKLAMEAVRNLPTELVHRVTRSTPFSREEEEAIANSGLKAEHDMDDQP